MALEISNVTDGSSLGARRVPKRELGKDDFLMLLTKQLQNQDPMKPMDNMEFVNQMASFSTLEQITNLGNSMESFINRSGESYKLQSMGLLGKTVVAQPADLPGPIEGVISSVKFVDGEAVYKVKVAKGDEQAFFEIKMVDINSIQNETT